MTNSLSIKKALVGLAVSFALLFASHAVQAQNGVGAGNLSLSIGGVEVENGYSSATVTLSPNEAVTFVAWMSSTPPGSTLACYGYNNPVGTLTGQPGGQPHVFNWKAPSSAGTYYYYCYGYWGSPADAATTTPTLTVIVN